MTFETNPLQEEREEMAGLREKFQGPVPTKKSRARRAAVLGASILGAFFAYAAVVGMFTHDRESEFVKNARERAVQLEIADAAYASGAALVAEGQKAIRWAQDCREANSGTGAAVDCSVIQSDGIGTETDEKEPQVLGFEPFTGSIFINPGHGKGEKGSRDWGATLRNASGDILFSERSIVKEIAEYAAKAVGNAEFVGFDPYTLRENIEFANRRARAIGCTFQTCRLVSIHANWSDSPDSSGAVAYYNEAVPGSKEIAERLAYSVDPANWRAAPDTANRNGRLGMVRDVENVNSFLVEVGYLSNKGDLFRLVNQKISMGQDIAHAISIK